MTEVKRHFSDRIFSDACILTVELSPPKGTDANRMLEHAMALKGRVDAINIPDSQRALLKMSSLVASVLIQNHTGIEAVWQLTCRDRNLIALQADLMGGYALGLRSVLALTGDPVQVGDQKDVAKQVFHLDSVRLLFLLSQLNSGLDATDTPLKSEGTHFVVGSALNPTRLFNPAQQKRLCQKLERGVHFFQTQPVYTLETAERMLDVVRDCTQQVGCPWPKVLLGIIPPKNANSARFMNDMVAGIEIPQTFIDLLESSADPVQESFAFCADLMHQLTPLADGFHIMPVTLEARIPELLDRYQEQVKPPEKQMV